MSMLNLANKSNKEL